MRDSPCRADWISKVQCCILQYFDAENFKCTVEESEERSNLQDSWDYILSFLSDFRAQRCHCRTWQINLQVRNNPKVFSGAEPPRGSYPVITEFDGGRCSVTVACMEEYVLPFCACYRTTLYSFSRDAGHDSLYIELVQTFLYKILMCWKKTLVHQDWNLSQEKVSFNKCSPFRKKYQQV